MRLDVSEVLTDPWLSGGRFDIIQNFIRTSAKGRRETVVERVRGVKGSVQPAGADELERLDDAERLNGAVEIYTKAELSCGSGATRSADEIFWKNRTYIVRRVDPWLFGRNYYHAVAVLKPLHGEVTARPT